jgi:uncharacterized membrane protein YbhN (UPF0104 family)
VLLALFQFPLVALRWRLIAQTMQTRGESLPSLRRFCEIVCIGSLFAQFMPFVAGDALRVLYLRDAGSSLRVAFKSTVVDRGSAAAVLFVAAPLTLLLAPRLALATAGVPALIGVAVAVLGLLAAALTAADSIARLAAPWRVAQVVAETLLDFRRIVACPGALSVVVLLSIAVHGMSCMIFALLASGEGLDLGLAGIVGVVPAILLAASLPIGIGGWGVREGLTVIMLAQLGVAPEAALLLSISFGVTVLLASLPGAPMLLLSLVERRGVPSGQVP